MHRERPRRTGGSPIATGLFLTLPTPARLLAGRFAPIILAVVRSSRESATLTAWTGTIAGYAHCSPRSLGSATARATWGGSPQRENNVPSRPGPERSVSREGGISIALLRKPLPPLALGPPEQGIERALFKST